MWWVWLLLESLSSCIRELGAFLELLWVTWDSLDLQQRRRGSSQVVVGISGFIFSYGGKLRVPLELQQGTQSSSQDAVGTQCSSRVAAWVSGLHSSCGGEPGVSLEFGRGT